MPVIKDRLTKYVTKHGPLVIIIAASLVLASIGTVSAAYYANFKPASGQIKLTPPQQVTLVVQGKKIGLAPAQLGWSAGDVDQAVLSKELGKIAASTGKKPQDAKIIKQNGNYVISPSAVGQQVDVAKAVKMVRSGLFAGQATIVLPLKQVAPKVVEASLQPKLQQLKAEQAAQLAQANTAAAQAQAVAPATSCATNPAGRKLVLVNLGSQHLVACDGQDQAYSTPITSGAYLAGMATPTGTYQIYSKSRNLYLTGPGYRYFVNYWVPFYSDYGFHDSSWQTFPYGSAAYASQGSHGCVHVPLAAMGWLYGWAPVGTTVTISP